MEAVLTNISSESKAMLWTGRIASGLIIAFMLLDSVMHIAKPAPVVQAFAELGFPISLSVPLGVIGLICVAFYALPRTSVIGAILLTGYYGGAVVTNLRVLHPAFECTFPVMLGVLAWGGLWMRDEKLRAMIPLKK